MIILASQSPRRHELMKLTGLPFTVRVADIDETMDPALPVQQEVTRVSRRKAQAIAAGASPDDIVIAADTIVALDDAVLGKPNDGLEAFRMLSALSGRRHQVYTGVTLLRDGERRTEHEVTTVTFRELTQDDITRYIATGEPMDKAGAYGIQGYGALLVERIEGDYFNVMGLPVCRLGRMLAGMGTDCLALAAGNRGQ